MSIKRITEKSGQPAKRTIKSFARRGRGLTDCQKEALKNTWPRVGLEPQSTLSFPTIFNRTAPCVLEIGFGNGETLAATAKQYPQYDFIGIEVHRSGIGHLLHLADENKLTNLRIIDGDAVQLLQDYFPNDALAAIHIFFPDPWPKKRHHKRRIIQADFVSLLAGKLMANGILHLATDWEDYANHMQRVMGDAAQYASIESSSSDMILARPTTKFESRGLLLGHDIWDFNYIKINN